MYSCNWDDGDLVSPPSLSPSLQPRLLQKPHRFLRDPLLRSDPARDGGLDHAVHNRIRPDVRLRLPAGVEEEEEGGGARGGGRVESRQLEGKFGRMALPAPLPPQTPAHPRRSYQSDAVLGSACFFWTISPSPIKRLWEKKRKKNQPGLACCYGETPHRHPALLSPPPPPPPPLLLLLLLLLFYSIRLHYCTSTAIRPLHLVSSPEPFGRCVAARHERRGERPTDERISKIKALLFVLET